MSRRLRDDFDEDINEEIDELASRLHFRNPNERKRNRTAKNEPSPKIKKNRPKYDEAEYDEF